MPTDGTLLLEHVPKHKRYLVMALSVFFSFGSVFSAIVGIIIIPKFSCPKDSNDLCDVTMMNLGWKHMLASIALIVSTIWLVLLYAVPKYSQDAIVFPRTHIVISTA